MLVIRLLRTGKKNQPFFKIVVTDKTKPPRAGRFVEEVGFYNPLTKEKNLKADRIKYWISVGAQPSNTIHNLLISEKIIEGKKISVHKKSKKQKEGEAPVAAPASAPAVTEKVAPVAAKPEEKKEKPKAEVAPETPAPEEPKIDLSSGPSSKAPQAEEEIKVEMQVSEVSKTEKPEA